MARVQHVSGQAGIRHDVSRNANKANSKNTRRRKFRKPVAKRQAHTQGALACKCENILPADDITKGGQDNDAGSLPMHTDDVPFVTLVYGEPPIEEIKFELLPVAGAEGGKLLIYDVQQAFQLKNMLLDGKTVDTDAYGYSVQCFKSGSIINVTGEPTRTYVPSGEMVTVELDGDPSSRKHFDLYDLDATGGRIHLDLVRLAFGLRTVKLDGVVLSRQQETALSNSRFKVDANIKITGKPA